MAARDTISIAIRKARDSGRPAIVAGITAGFPSKEKFAENLQAMASAADVIEICVPFSDPMADGTTIQRSSRVALAQGVSLKWILEFLSGQKPVVSYPIILMTYLNPLLAFGLDKLAKASAEAGVAGFIVPDLPYEESADLRAALDKEGLALVQLVTPVTPDDRLAMLCKASQGFVYAVTMTGTTGKNVAVPNEVLDYLDRVRKVSPLPVCAGFGIRSSEQVRLMDEHVDGVVVASALVEVLERSEDPAAFLRELRT
ncbi:MAG: tryptophan synthase subunit alpha [Candidatus Obscuribacterales bacterium]|nr:tryptophan synthase subunit alpha [Steroidobacteraceae bacterium]